MSVPEEVVLGGAFALVLVALAAALPWGGERIRHRRDLAGLGPSCGIDAQAVYMGSSAILLLLAAALMIGLGMRHASPSVLATTGAIGAVVVWAGGSMWKKSVIPRTTFIGRMPR